MAIEEMYKHTSLLVSTQVSGHLSLNPSPDLTWLLPRVIMKWYSLAQPLLVLHISMYGFPNGSVTNNPSAMQETQDMRVQPLGQEDPLEEGMATHSSILSWRIPWTEEPSRLQSIGLQRAGHNWSNLASSEVRVGFFLGGSQSWQLLLPGIETQGHFRVMALSAAVSELAWMGT